MLLRVIPLVIITSLQSDGYNGKRLFQGFPQFIKLERIPVMAKYLIKCPKCGQMVETSEYTMLCQSCGKKLENSFRECQKRDPELTYRDYLDRYCVNELAVGGMSEQRRISRNAKLRKGASRTAVTVLLVIVASVAVLAGIWILSPLFTGHSIKRIVDETWRNEYYEDLSCNIKFSHTLSLQPAEIADSTLGIREYVSRSWKEDGVCLVNALKIDYMADSSANIDRATETILQSMVQSNGMQGFSYVPGDYRLQGSSARMFSGSYLVSVDMFEFRAVMVVRENIVWYFMVAYPSSLPEGTILADKLFDGIQLLSD